MKPTRNLSLPEFIALMAAIFAVLAFSIDAMLPAFPQIAEEVTPDAVNRAQLVLTSFVFGMGLGTIFTGPLSDAFGRKAVITAGLGLYIVGAALAYVSQSLELILAARVLQGLGAAAPRTVPMAMMRDLYEGRKMAQIGSFVMTVFMLVPAVAPSIGALVIDLVGWRYIFVLFITIAVIVGLWLNIRQPETLPAEERRPLNWAATMAAVGEVMSNRLVVIYIAVMTLGFSQMFATISSTQQIYDITYGKGESFPTWFAVSALIAISGTLINASLVMTVGMRRIVITAYAAQTVLSLAFLMILVLGIVPAADLFWLWFFWSVSIFFMAGLTFGNLNALALQPLGHIAGTAASVITAISTILSVIIAAPIGLAFDGTPVPLLAGTVLCSGLAYVLMRRTTDDVVQEA